MGEDKGRGYGESKEYDDDASENGLQKVWRVIEKNLKFLSEA